MSHKQYITIIKKIQPLLCFYPLGRVPFEVDRRDGIRGYAGNLGGPKETRGAQAGEGGSGFK